MIDVQFIEAKDFIWLRKITRLNVCGNDNVQKKHISLDPALIHKRAQKIAKRYAYWHQRKTGHRLDIHDFHSKVTQATMRLTGRQLGGIHHEMAQELTRKEQLSKRRTYSKPVLSLI